MYIAPRANVMQLLRYIIIIIEELTTAWLIIPGSKHYCMVTTLSLRFYSSNYFFTPCARGVITIILAVASFPSFPPTPVVHKYSTSICPVTLNTLVDFDRKKGKAWSNLARAQV